MNHHVAPTVARRAALERAVERGEPGEISRTSLALADARRSRGDRAGAVNAALRSLHYADRARSPRSCLRAHLALARLYFDGGQVVSSRRHWAQVERLRRSGVGAS